MSKRVRSIIIVAVSLAILIAALIIINALPQKKDPDIEGNSSAITSSEQTDFYGNITVFSFKEEQFKSVSVKNSFGGYEMVRTADNKLKIAGVEDFALNSESIDSVLSSCIGFSASKVIGENIKNLSDYGIDDNSTQATISYTTGEKLTVKIGELSSSGGRYIYVEENDKVYLNSSSWASPFEFRKQDFIDLTVIEPLDTDEEGNEIEVIVKKFSFIGNALKNPVIVERNPEFIAAEKNEDEDNIYSEYIYTSPIVADLSDEKFLGIESSYYGLTAQSVHIINPTQADLTACGISSPSLNLEIVAATRTDKVIVGNSLEVDGEKYYYCKNVNKKPIFIVSASEFDFAFADPIDYISSIVVNAHIDEIKTMQFDYQGNKYVFETTGEGEDLIVRYNGKKLSTGEYRDLYQAVMLVFCEESVVKGQYTGAPELKITYTYREREKVDSVEYVKVAPRKYMIRKNGNDLALVRSTYVDFLTKGLADFLAGRDVSTSY